jgi:hypothetical protein
MRQDTVSFAGFDRNGKCGFNKIGGC